MWELDVPLARGRFENEDDVRALVAGFHTAHERVFAVSEPGQHVECIYWKARATARLPKPLRQVAAPADGLMPEPVATRDAWFGGAAPEPTPRYDGPGLSAGSLLAGPCVIQEPTTTIVVFPGWHALVTAEGDYMMTRQAA